MTRTFCGFQTVACFVYIELIATLTKSFQSFVVTVTLAAAVLLESLLFLWYIYVIDFIHKVNTRYQSHTPIHFFRNTQYSR